MSDYLDELLFLCTLGLSVIIFQLVFFEQVWALVPGNFHCLSIRWGSRRKNLLQRLACERLTLISCQHVQIGTTSQSAFPGFPEQSDSGHCRLSFQYENSRLG